MWQKQFDESLDLGDDVPKEFQEQMKQNMEQAKKLHFDSFLQVNRISSKQLKEIEAEGLANGWPGSNP
jgi:hypothetical protein